MRQEGVARGEGGNVEFLRVHLCRSDTGREKKKKGDIETALRNIIKTAKSIRYFRSGVALFTRGDHTASVV